MKKIIIIGIAAILLITIIALITYKVQTMPVSKNVEEKQIEIPLRKRKYSNSWNFKKQ